FPVDGPTHVGGSVALDEDDVARGAGMTRHRAIGAPKQSDHANDRRRIDRARGTLIVERDIAAGHRRPKRATGVRNAATGLAELIEDFRTLRAAKVQAVGDAEWPPTGAGDVASGLGDGRLAAFVRIEPHVAAVTVGLHR